MDEPFQRFGGRKWLITLLGMGLCTLLPLLGKASTEAIGAIGAMVLAYNGANTAVSWAWSKQTTEQVERGGKAIEDGDVL